MPGEGVPASPVAQSEEDVPAGIEVCSVAGKEGGQHDAVASAEQGLCDGGANVPVRDPVGKLQETPLAALLVGEPVGKLVPQRLEHGEARDGRVMPIGLNVEEFKQSRVVGVGGMAFIPVHAAGREDSERERKKPRWHRPRSRRSTERFYVRAQRPKPLATDKESALSAGRQQVVQCVSIVEAKLLAG
jgi:hypothetical protein